MIKYILVRLHFIQIMGQMTSIRINGTARLVEWIDLNFVKKRG